MTAPVRLQITRHKGSDRPIIMSDPMVRAIKREIAAPGTGKTQTRRIIPLGNVYDDLSGEACDEFDGRAGWRLFWRGDVRLAARVPCAVGDRLWVRERFLPDPSRDDDAWDDNRVSSVEWDGTGCRLDDIPPKLRRSENCIYMADPRWRGNALDWLWRPSIHMPRWASRLTLIVTDVRVEMLQDISEADAKAEGLACLSKDGGRLWKYGIADRDGWPGTDDDGWPWHEWNVDPRRAYATLRDRLHGKGAWDGSPWVAAITFRPILANIDSLPSDLAARPACDEVRP